MGVSTGQERHAENDELLKSNVRLCHSETWYCRSMVYYAITLVYIFIPISINVYIVQRIVVDYWIHLNKLSFVDNEIWFLSVLTSEQSNQWLVSRGWNRMYYLRISEVTDVDYPKNVMGSSRKQCIIVFNYRKKIKSNTLHWVIPFHITFTHVHFHGVAFFSFIWWFIPFDQGRLYQN